jgi:hypothetical protein
MVALEWLVEMLEHPDRYEWVRAEADDAGILDDVVARKRDGHIVARQVKYSTRPDTADDPWTWAQLLEPGVSPAKKVLPSLLSKLADSWELLSANESTEVEAELVSNRQPAEDVKNSIDAGGRIRFDLLPHDCQSEVIAQLGGESRTLSFLEHFRLKLDRPSLRVLEDSLLHRFFMLGGTDEGWMSLKQELRRWVAYKEEPLPEGLITVASIRKAGRWRQLRSLLEQFVVPEDYVLPSEEFHQRFRRLILERNCLVLTGKPGLGKSTYLSFLVDQLKQEEIPVIRHHYFLSTGDRTLGRLDHTRIAESLMTELHSCYPEALGVLGSRNPNPADLRKWIDACGTYFASQEQRLYVVIDGLDHVWRETESREELNLLFEHLLPGSVGVHIVVGSQPIDDGRLPQRLLSSAPRSEWQELRSLDVAAVRTWLAKYADGLDLTAVDDHAREFQLERLGDAFYKKSAGHPLHMRYTLAALLERGLPHTPEAVATLPGVAHQEIEQYYNELWRELPDTAREILHLLAATRFPWPSSGLVDCLESGGQSRSGIVGARRLVGHLLTSDPFGDRAYHSSLLAFVLDQPEHGLYARSLRKKALEWLRSSAPPYWRSAYEWVLEADLGNAEPLLVRPNRTWAVDWFARRYPRDELRDILWRSAWLALEKRNLQRFTEVGLLRDYVVATEYRPDVTAALLPAQIWLEDDDYLRLRLRASIEELGDGELATLAASEYQRGNREALEQCLAEVNQRLSRPPPTAVSFGENQWRDRLRVSATIAALSGIGPKQIADVARSMEGEGNSEAVTCSAALTFRRAQLVDPLRALMREDESSSRQLTRHTMMLAIEQGVELPKSEAANAEDIYCSLYCALQDPDGAGSVTPWRDLPDVRPLDYFARRPVMWEFFHWAFFYFVTRRLKEEESPHPWGPLVTDDAWTMTILGVFEEAAIDVAERMSKRQPLGPALIYSRFIGIARPDFASDREHADLGVGVRHALSEIMVDLLSISQGTTGEASITAEDLDTAFDTEYCDAWSFIDAYLDTDRRWMSDEVAVFLIGRMEAELDSSIVDFPTRAIRFARLATLASRHELEDDVRRLIAKAADNSIAYGEHKDLLLHSTLKALEAYQAVDAVRSEGLLYEVARVVAAVDEFTDGDETSHLQAFLGDILSKIRPGRVAAYYGWLCEQERYDDAEVVFRSFLADADLQDEIVQALARTAVDERSLEILQERMDRGDQGAAAAVGALQETLGPVRFRELESAGDGEAPSRSESPEEPLRLDPRLYPPPRIREFLSASRSPGFVAHEELVARWVRSWADAEEGSEALQAVESLVESDGRIRVSNDLFDLALAIRGRAAAYDWLVRAQRDNHGWIHFFAPKEEVLFRWEAVSNYYPEKWFDFLADSISPNRREGWELGVRDALTSIVEYLIYMNQADLALVMTSQAVRSVSELVSALDLHEPTWVLPPS